MINKNQNIGIWGLGIVGKSVIRFLHSQGYENLTVLERRELSLEDWQFLLNHNITYFNQDLLAAAAHPELVEGFLGSGESNIHNFLEQQDFIISSPGVDLRPYKQWQQKFITELDLFYYHWNNRAPLIAITGTAGKTSVTHLISELLKKSGFKVVTGGNIGTALLDLLPVEKPDFAVIELSSFQLESCKLFKPDYALWTNLFPKHLDRHGTLQEYFDAKYQLIARQLNMDYALLPLELESQIRKKTDRQLCWFSLQQPAHYHESDRYYYKNAAGDFVCYAHHQEQIMIPAAAIPTFSYEQNWLMITALLQQLGLDGALLFQKTHNLTLPQHRLELVATKNMIEFYNDSKSTLMQSTQLALERLAGKKIVLLLGGISENVDRTQNIPELKDKVTAIVCFGAEAELLNNACVQHGVKSCAVSTLEEAVACAITNAQENNCNTILLSPAGPSYDLFKNYEERGKRFVDLVKQWSLL